MKNKILLLSLVVLFSFAFVTAIPVTDSHQVDITGSTTGETVNLFGVIIQPNLNVSLISVDKTSATTATKVYVWNAVEGLIASADFVGDTATFSSYPILNEGTLYALTVSNEGITPFVVNYAISVPFPISGTNIDYYTGNNEVGFGNWNESYYFDNGSDVLAGIVSVTTEEYVEPPVQQNQVQGLMRFWKFDKLEDTPITGEVTSEPSQTQEISFVTQIINWLKGLFN